MEVLEGDVKRVSILLVLFACLAGILSGCGGGSAPAPVPLNLSIDRTSLPGGRVNAPYSQSVAMTAFGGTSPYVYFCTVSDGASGLSAVVSSPDPVTGSVSCVISGTPLTAGEVTVNFSVTDMKASASAGLLSISISPPADPLDNWHLRNSLPVGNLLYDVTYGNGIFVAVGRNDIAHSGAIVTSADGITWTSRTSGNDETMRGVIYGNGIFVAVSNAGRIYTSDDGINWISRSSGTSADLYEVTYGNGTFLTFGSKAVPYGVSYVVILASADGITWTKTNCNDLETNCENVPGVSRVTFGKGMFLGIDSSGVSTSTDGITWTSRPSEIDEPLRGVTYGNGMFVAVGNAGGIYTSDDGMTWRISSPPGHAALTAVTAGNGTFVAVGFTAPSGPGFGLTPGVILTSPDGITWTFRDNAGIYLLAGVAYGNGTFMAVGGNNIYQSDPVQ